MNKRHHYTTTTNWTGNQGKGTSDYRAYSRNHTYAAAGKPVIEASSDPAFRGDPSRYNPEDLLVASLSGCHMLTYLHLCAVNGVIVTAYEDEAKGVMEETGDGGGAFAEVVLYPRVTVTDEHMVDTAMHLHEKASALCFIARSVNFPVRHQPRVHCDEKN